MTFSFNFTSEDWQSFQEKSNDKIHPYCPTDDLWDWKLVISKAFQNTECPTQNAICDNPDQRDKFSEVSVTISVVFVVLCQDKIKGDCVTTHAAVEEQFDTLVADLEAYSIHFRNDGVYFVDSKYATISAYGPSSEWYEELEALKVENSVSPDQHINVFVSKQASSEWGTLLGIGTFPWDPEFLQSTGGLWINAQFFGADEATLSHEFGHNLGLWHTFHGSEEVDPCGDCAEPPHTAADMSMNFVGDRCADTAATPMNYACAQPKGKFPCSNTKWSKTNLGNIMSYTPDDCHPEEQRKSLTDQQQARAKCYLCQQTPSILTSTKTCPSI